MGCPLHRLTSKNQFSKFEVLLADPKGVQWVRYSYQLKVGELGATPVEGGKEASGELLYIARVKYNDGYHPAKIGEHLPGAHLAYNNTEVTVDVRISYTYERPLRLMTLATGLRSVVLQLTGT